MTYYDYPPSSYILKHCDSPLVHYSHYFIEEGSIELENGNVLTCSFEIAYTQENSIIIICYPLESSLTWKRQFQQQQVAKIYGFVTKQHKNVLVEEPIYRFGDNFIGFYVFSVTPSYSIEYLKTNCSVLEFDRLYRFYISGFDFPFGYSNSSSGDHEIDFRLLGDNAAISLKCLLSENTRILFKNQRTGALHIYPRILVSGWDVLAIADWWTALVSIAIGNNVEWLHCSVPRNDHAFYEEQWIYRNSLSVSQKFLSIIVQPHLKKDNIQSLQDFISISLETILTSGHDQAYWGGLFNDCKKVC